jgi:hypothetical protein
MYRGTRRGSAKLDQSSLPELAATYSSVQDALSSLSVSSPDDEEGKNELAEQLYDLAWLAAEQDALTGADLVAKASILQDWVAPTSEDLTTHLTASLCSDITRLYAKRPSLIKANRQGSD